MIEEAYVNFETAKLLKEKGFDEECFALYNPDGVLIQSGIRLNNIQVSRVKGSYSAPTQQMTMRLLREKHLLHISIDMMNGGRWGYEIDNISVPFDGGVLPEYYCDSTFSSYEEAADDAIKYCSENLI